MKRWMGLDVGDRTIGLAVSDLLGITAQGLKTLKRSSMDGDLENLRSIIEEKEVGVLVVGLPKNMDGSVGSQGQKVVGFANFLKKRLPVEVVLWDERLTSRLAYQTMQDTNTKEKLKKERVDMLAAQNILQSYMDSIKK
ncbi:Holliday junction resolvase RuvX [Alkalibacter rhizosphaerae]|uniref:Putative pre-16S rRNA nuclease n=1 Tax=Alkalibacter rhizosphaerae TaxID=2815577 RepID=A0A975AI33_9FIRM|nr:Holliday junction resolvase RuvX [Alkalibacter rhizosphaerae]QSX08663.1 Holliday junction resolvase RuvX [Alkalibacter rhizosphaerae]